MRTVATMTTERPSSRRSRSGAACLSLAAVFALGLAATGCSGDEVTAVESSAAPIDLATTAVAGSTDVNGLVGAVAEGGDVHAAATLRPGEGVKVTAGMQSEGWSRFRAELYRQLLSELGFEVSDPWEMGPNVAYLWMAAGDVDYWTDGRFPSHQVWLNGASYDGSRVGDHVSAVGAQMPVGNVLGWLISKTFADEHGVFTMDDLNRDPTALGAFDATDAVPANGKADVLSLGGIYDSISRSQAAFSGWDNIAFVSFGEEVLSERAVNAANAGYPVVMFVGTPSALTATLEPGTDVYWLGVEDFLDTSNPLGHIEGELFSQATRGHDGAGGYAAINALRCPAAASHPDGLCPLGWVANDMAVAASNDFLAANPAAATLLEAATFSQADVSQALAQQADGSDPTDLAAEWIAANRASVDEWLTAARAAASGG